MGNLQTRHEQYLQSIIADQASRISSLEADQKTLIEIGQFAKGLVEKLEAECAALKVDAERYRWLRGKSWTDQSDGGFSGSHRLPSFQAWRDDEDKKTRIQRRDLDAAIDAAMQAGEKL